MKVPFEAVIRGELEVPDHLTEFPDLSRWLQDKVELGLLPYCRPLALFDIRPPTTHRVLDMSTKHVAEADVKWLSEPGPHLLTREYEYGWWIHIVRDDPEWLASVRESGMPESILVILKFALDHQCDYIFLDQAGADYPELPSYNW